METSQKYPAVFFDRDGTLMEEADYCDDPKTVSVYPGVIDALDRLKQHGFKNIIITNQSGIGRGFFSEAQYQQVHAELLRQIGGDLIDATYHCPATPEENSRRRKPNPEMIFEAAHDHDIDLRRSFFVGDKSSDIECGHRAGVRAILVKTGYGENETNCAPDFFAKDVVAAVEIILGNSDV